MHDGGADAGHLVGGHRDAVARAADADAEVDRPAGHRSTHCGAIIRVVDRGGGVVGAEVGDVVPEAGQLGPQELLQIEPGVIRADGNAHGHRVYRRPRGAPGPLRRPPVRSSVHGPRPPHARRRRRRPGFDAGRRRAGAGGPARAARADDVGAAGGRGGLRRRGAGRLGPFGFRAVAPGRQHPRRGATRLARRQRGPGRGVEPGVRPGFGAGPADGLGHRWQLPAGAHARRLPRHRPRRPRRGPGDRRRGDVRPRSPGATRPSRGSNGRPSRPRPRRPSCSGSTSRARPSSR